MNEENENKPITQTDLLRMATEVVSAYVARNDLVATQIPDLIHTVYQSLKDLGFEIPELKAEPQKPFVSVRKSISPDYLICLEDGKKLKMLKRHLRTMYNMSPDEYRAKWNLPSDYPMVSPNYARQRSEFAKQIGLGRGAAGRKQTRRRRNAS